AKIVGQTIPFGIASSYETGVAVKQAVLYLLGGYVCTMKEIRFKAARGIPMHYGQKELAEDIAYARGHQ
ncbi:MAG: hypothetical protein ABSE90_09325, partial [Verrucomicrobiota bacterium]